MPPSALRSASRKNGPRRVGAKGKRFVGESALQKYARLQRERRNTTAMSRRRGAQASSSTAAKSRKSRAARKVRVAANENNMKVEQQVRRSRRLQELKNKRNATEKANSSNLAGASAKVRAVPKSRKTHKVVPQKFHAATVAVPAAAAAAAAENWGGHDANDEFENLANRLGRARFFNQGVQSAIPKGPITSWPPSRKYKNNNNNNNNNNSTYVPNSNSER